MSSEKGSGRKKGAQPNNKNALKHGLYAQRISLLEDEKLGGVKLTEIEGEIAYLRAACARMPEILENIGVDRGERD